MIGFALYPEMTVEIKQTLIKKCRYCGCDNELGKVGACMQFCWSCKRPLYGIGRAEYETIENETGTCLIVKNNI